MTDLTSQDITAIASVVVAALAMITTVWQAMIAREHNRKSTIPLLEFHGDHRDGVQIYIRNDGVGPAVIKQVRHFVDSNICEDINEFDKNLGVPDNIEYFRSEFSLPSVIGVGQSVLLLSIKAKIADGPVVKSLIERVSFQISYESVYGQSFDTEHYQT